MGWVTMEFPPGNDAAFEARLDELIQQFDAFVQPLLLMVDAQDLNVLLNWKRRNGDGRLGHWTRTDVSTFLLEWCPGHLATDAEGAHALPGTVALYMSFLAQENLLSGDKVDHLVDHALAQQADFLAAMSDKSTFGPAKSVFDHLGVQDLDDVDDLQGLIDQFNALPEDERRAVTDPALGQQGTEPPLQPIGPFMLPSDEELRSSVEAAPLLRGFRLLGDYFADGKPLTDRGNLALDDAIALGELLGTGETDVDMLGGQTYPKRSSRQFPHVDHWQWWARQCGLLRQQGNRLMTDRAWLDRSQADPLDTVLKAFDILMDFGPLSSMNRRRLGPDAELMDELTETILGRLLVIGDSDFDDLEDWTDDVLDEVGGVDPEQDIDAHDLLDQFLTLMERSGVVIQSDVREGTLEGTSIRSRSGGRISVTPLGSSVIIARLEQGGYPVTTVPTAEDLEVVELVELTTDVTFAPDSWWPLTTRWLAQQSDPTALATVLERIAEQDMAILAYLLEAPPDDAREPLLATLRPLVTGTEPDPTGLRALAMGWLVQIGELDLSSLDKGAALEAMIAALAVMARTSPEAIPAALAQERSRDEQLEMIREMGGQMPAGVVDVLEAIGGTHPDKVVAKAARKELFRVRSRQVNAPRN